MKAKHSAAWLEAAREGAFGVRTRLLVMWHLRRFRHARECLEADADLGRQLRAGLPPYQVPDEFGTRIAAALEREPAPPRVKRQRLPFAATFAGGGLAGLAAGVLLALVLRTTMPTANLRHELLDSHIRSLLGEHLTDLGTTDQHAVKPWLSSRLGLSPPVQEIEGFVLVGGRLDYLDGHAVAAVVYKRRQHVINLYAWTTRQHDTSTRESADRGFNIITWRQKGLALAAVSDLNMRELRQFVRAFGPS